MIDRVSIAKRSEIMRSVRSKHTGPELLIRSAAHRLGLRFRLHDGKLPGRPDLVFPRWKTVVFVNGCYWHRHANCKKATVPKSNTSFWHAKFEANLARDERNYRDLSELGWRVIVVWQCEAKSLAEAINLLSNRFFTQERCKDVPTKPPRKRGTRSERS